MNMYSITLPDGSVREMPAGSTPADVAAAIGPGLAKAAIAARVDGELRDITRPFEGDTTLALVTSRVHADGSKAVRELGFNDQVPLATMVENCITWMATEKML